MSWLLHQNKPTKPSAKSSTKFVLNIPEWKLSYKISTSRSTKPTPTGIFITLFHRNRCPATTSARQNCRMKG